MTRTYFICPKHIAEVAIRHATSYHFADLGNGNVLLSADFESEARQRHFERHASVQTLPHVLDATPLEPQHIEHVKHLGVNHGHTMKHLRDFARKKLHRLL